MNYKQKLGYFVFGGLFSLIGLGLGAGIGITNQDTFGDITCRSLKIISQDGRNVINLSANKSANLEIYSLVPDSLEGMVKSGVNLGSFMASARMKLYSDAPREDKAGLSNQNTFSIGSNKGGVNVFMYDSNGKEKVFLNADNDGGTVTLDSERGISYMISNKDRVGVVVYDKYNDSMNAFP